MVLKKIVLTSALALSASLISAGSLTAETLKISTFVPPKHAFNRVLTAWGEELAEKSGGELTVEIFPAGQLGPPPRQFDLVRSGGADIALVLHSATPGRFPITELAGLPLTSPAAGSDSAISSKRLTELAPEYLAAEHAGTRILWMAVTPPLKLHVSFDPSDLGNFEGKRIRYAGAVWQQVVEALGAAPVPVPPAEAADAMGKGVVDGAAFPFEATIPFDLAPVSTHSLAPGIAAATFGLVMNEAAFDRLSDEHKALIEETTGPERAAEFGALWDAGEGHGRTYLEEGGVTIVEMTDDQIEDLRGKLSGIIDRQVSAASDKGLPATAFLEAFTE